MSNTPQAFASAAPPLPATTTEATRAPRFAWGEDRVPVAADAVTPADAAAPEAPRARARSAFWTWTSTWRGMAVLGPLGFVAGGGVAGIFAWRMGYAWPLATQIGLLAGAAAAAVFMMIPPLARALTWASVAAGFGAVGAGAAWLLWRVAPAFAERVLDLVR